MLILVAMGWAAGACAGVTGQHVDWRDETRSQGDKTVESPCKQSREQTTEYCQEADLNIRARAGCHASQRRYFCADACRLRVIACRDSSD